MSSEAQAETLSAAKNNMVIAPRRILVTPFTPSETADWEQSCFRLAR